MFIFLFPLQLFSGMFAGAVSKILQPRLAIIMCSIFSSVGLLGITCASNVYLMMLAMLLTGNILFCFIYYIG